MKRVRSHPDQRSVISNLPWDQKFGCDAAICDDVTGLDLIFWDLSPSLILQAGLWNWILHDWLAAESLQRVTSGCMNSQCQNHTSSHQEMLVNIWFTPSCLWCLTSVGFKRRAVHGAESWIPHSAVRGAKPVPALRAALSTVLDEQNQH